MTPSAAPAVSAAGLTSAEAAQRLRRDGPNAVGREGHRGPLAILVSQFASPLVLILVAASLVSFAVHDQVEAAIILTIVVLSAALGFVQEARSAAAVEALQARLALKATVIRDGKQQDLPIVGLVCGDLIILGAGDIVPADARILESNHLYIDESSLTGESAASAKVSKDGDLDPAKEDDRDGLAFFGTSIVSGSGKAVVTATGARTSYGAIARRLLERAPRTDFQEGVRAFGFLITRVTLILVVGVFAINVALNRPILDALLFSVALAVGLTPELLPAIVTLNLTRGARALTAHGVLVKRLPAIQNLGSVTVFCTDKTGTLTQGKLELVKAVGIDKDDAGEASQALTLAYLNSHFQASFENPLDAAILAAAPKPKDLAAYRKLAELPYDFTRRLLSVVVDHKADGPLLVTKGAPESIVARCSRVREDHAARPLRAAERARLKKLVDGASAEGYRLVAVASRSLAPADLRPSRPSGPAASLADADRLERGLTFEGVILFSDPPKPGVGETIAELARQGIALKVITGDNDLVARHVAEQVGLTVDGVLTGDEMRRMTHPALVARVGRTTIFARVDPDQKLQVIRAVRESGHVVGYMGDGINDAPALHVADVGISVDNATDVARSAADIILLEPSLEAISRGVVEGRRTFANTLKYIRMGTSSNFGNMLSMAGAALLLPFLPMTPGQILLNNLIYDASQTAIPTDHVDPDVEAVPARWDVHAIERFMILFGPISSIFDYATFGLLILLLGSSQDSAKAFHAGWFVESLFTQILVVLAIRTRMSPFWRSRPSRPLAVAIFAALAVAVIVPLSPLGLVLGFGALPVAFWLLLVAIVAAYLTMVEVAKRIYDNHEVRRTAAAAATRGPAVTHRRPAH
ncbi:MAG: magnesium-translocating P-type ATPase [Candidatus Limnocylindrales bacterium]